MSTTFNLLVSLWGHVGPGVVLAFALPVFLIAFGVIVLVATRQVRDRRHSGEASLADETA